MIGISQIARYARRWNTQRKRAAMENAILNLPAELQKDIGCPAPTHRSTPDLITRDIHARPIL